MSIEQVRALLAANRQPDGPPDIMAMRANMDALGAAAPLPDLWRILPVTLGARMAEQHAGPDAVPGRTLLWLHGGGYVAGSPKSHRGVIAQIANAARAVTYALDYRCAPEHPFPAAVEDAVAALHGLYAQGVEPKRLAIGGDSAGGGLALAAALRLRDSGAPMPAALALVSPWADLSNAGMSHTTKAAADLMVRTAYLDHYAHAYLRGEDRRSPLASPIFADLSGLPSILVQVGSDEVLLSDSEALYVTAEKAGVDIALETWPGMAHVWHYFYPILPEARDAIEGLGGWIARRLG